jgi:hypothetical protein
VRKKEKRIGKRRKRSKIGSINGLQEVGLSDVLRDFHLGVAQKLLTQCENDNFSWLILGCLLCFSTGSVATTTSNHEHRRSGSIWAYAVYPSEMTTSTAHFSSGILQANATVKSWTWTLGRIKTTREIIMSYPSKNLFRTFGTPFFCVAIFCRPREISQHKPAVSAQSWWRPYHVRCDVGHIVPPCALLGRLCQSKKRFCFFIPIWGVVFCYAVVEVITLLGAEGDGTEWKGDHYAMTTHIINCCRVLTRYKGQFSSISRRCLVSTSYCRRWLARTSFACWWETKQIYWKTERTRSRRWNTKRIDKWP